MAVHRRTERALCGLIVSIAALLFQSSRVPVSSSFIVSILCRNNTDRGLRDDTTLFTLVRELHRARRLGGSRCAQAHRQDPPSILAKGRRHKSGFIFIAGVKANLPETRSENKQLMHIEIHSCTVTFFSLQGLPQNLKSTGGFQYFHHVGCRVK